ncbi:B12-binding domain-containing radical SAM protein [Thermodesulfobacteriota bacterium]
MKILLVYCNSMLENALPVGITQLSSCLKEAGIRVDLFDTTFYKWGEKSATENRIEALQIKPCPLRYKKGDLYEDFKRKIEDFSPTLIGFSVVEPTLKLAIKMLNCARDLINSGGIRVAMGGVHTIMAPETVELLTDMVDFVCISEGELAFVNLCNKLEKGDSVKNVQGFWVREKDRWIKNDLASIVDLEALPILDFRLFPSEFLYKPMLGRLYRTISIEVTRGCPYSCAYCCDHSLAKVFKNSGFWYRQKSIKKISSELEQYLSEYDPEFVYIMSESFLAGSLKRLETFFEMYGMFSLPFWFNTRPEDITEEKAKMAKKGGCARSSIGIESGNEAYRKKVMHRNVSNRRILESATILRDYDISFSVNLIIGSPDETREMIFDSIEIARKANADAVSTHIFSPYYGTEFRDICVRKGYIQPDMIADDFFLGYSLKGGPLSPEEVMGLFRTIPLYVSFPKSEYKRIQRAEKFDDRGNRLFNELEEEYYELMGWSM